MEAVADAIVPVEVERAGEPAAIATATAEPRVGTVGERREGAGYAATYLPRSTTRSCNS